MSTRNGAAPSRSSPLAIAGLLVLLAWACAPRSPVVPWPASQGPFRFIDHLDAATISSPLLGPPAEKATNERRPRETVWRLDKAVLEWLARPDEDNPREIAWGCSSDGARSVRCVNGFQVRLRPAVEPGSHYRLRVAGRGVPEGCAEAQWVERPQQVQQLAVTMSEVRAHLRTGFGTRRLEVSVHPRRPGQPCAVESLRIELDRLAVDSPTELALLAAEDSFEGADAALGMAKRGAFLPAIATALATPPRDENYSLREALLAPTPTRISLRVRLPPRARLRLGYGLHRASRLDDEARFEVRLSPERGEDALLLAETLWAEPRSWYWREKLIDLDRWAGQEVEIALVTWSALDHPVYALWASPALEVPRSAPHPPNVILIAIDTLRADRLGSLGHGGGLTPHLDALAADGVLFRQAVSPGNWTLPAFASLFTGQGAHQHGVLRHTDALAPAATTLAETLRRAGWATEAILYKPTLYLGNRLEQGFERYFNVPIVAPRGDLNLEKAARWLEANRDRRFFLFLHWNDPHQPFRVPAESLPAELRAEMESFGVAAGNLDIEETLAACRRERCGDPDAAREFQAMGRALYDREVAYVDAFIGELVADLKRLGLYEDAVVALVSDHGETLWEHDGHYGHGGPNFRDDLLHVPLIVKLPTGRGPAPGTEVAAQVSTADLAATLLELAGLAVAETRVNGSSLSRFWSGQAAGLTAAAPAFSLGSQGESVRRGGFRYMRGIRPGGGGAEWLFDLARDPGEHVDAALREPALFEELRALAVEESARWAAGGALVLVRAAVEAGAHEISLSFSAPASRQEFDSFGIALAGCEGRICHYAGTPRGRLALADLFAAPREAEVEIELRSSGRPVWRARLELVSAAALAPGAGARFLAGDGPGALALWASPGHASAAGGAPFVRSAEQHEALQALGYLDE